MSSSSTLSPAPADFWDKYHAERSSDVTLAPGAPREREREPRLAGRPPRRRRPIRAFFRFLITVGIGVGGTLAWQAYGDTAREMAAATFPDQLGWLTPPSSSDAPAAAAPAVAVSAATVGTAASAPAVDQQQLNAVSLGLAGVRRSVEELAAQVASGQQQMAGDIARLEASEQDILSRISAPPRPAPAAAHRPAPAPLAPAASAAPAAPAAH
jgi:hypothetical protein